MIYTCKCCNYQTEFKRNYVKHISTQKHINNFKTNKYCDLCNKNYTSSKSFKTHFNREHSNYFNNLISNTNIVHSADNNIVHSADNNIVHSADNNIVHSADNNIVHSADNDKLLQQVINAKEEINDNINKSNKEVVKVVNKAINRASSLIKYLMEHHQSTPPLRKIKQKDSIDLLRIDYNCPLDKVKNPFALEKNFIDDYRTDMFVKNISKSILKIVNYKNPDKQPLWNTDCTRYNFVVKTNVNTWDEDKCGVKFTDYVIRPLLKYISDMICNYRTVDLEKRNIKNFTSEQIKDHFTYLNESYKLETDILRDSLIKDILKELSPHLRYLQSELDELEELEELNKSQESDNDETDDDSKEIFNNNDDNYDEKQIIENVEELEQLQEDLQEIAKLNNKYNDSDNSDSKSDSDSSIYNEKHKKYLEENEENLIRTTNFVLRRRFIKLK
jgi:hypothetical protein